MAFHWRVFVAYYSVITQPNVIWMNGFKSFLMVHSFWIFSPPSCSLQASCFVSKTFGWPVSIIPKTFYKCQMVIFSIPAIHVLLPLLLLSAWGLHPWVARMSQICIHISIKKLYLQCFPYVEPQSKTNIPSTQNAVSDVRGLKRIRSFWWTKVLFLFFADAARARNRSAYLGRPLGSTLILRTGSESVYLSLIWSTCHLQTRVVSILQSVARLPCTDLVWYY